MTTIEVTFPSEGQAGKILKWRVRTDTMVSAGRVLFLYQNLVSGNEDVKGPEKKFRATRFGRVKKLMAKEGDIIQPGQLIILLEGCKHPTVMKDLCAECGADLRLEGVDNDGENVGISQASVPMVHSIPELKVCPELAQKIGKEDEDRLLRDKKLALLVDLDQTIVHTTNDNIPPNIKDVYHYQLYGPNSPWYHTRLRPNTRHFLSEMSRLYELHICTFGARNYAHTVASLLDKDGILFSHRILSRDECFDPASKTANLKALFPCGDDLVCIIDDREDVWQGCGNLVQVKPYHFFRHTGDIHAPPGLEKNSLPSLPDLSNTELCTNVQNKDNKNGIMESLKGETVTDNYIKREIKTEPIENNDECVENDEDTKISVKEDIESKENINANNFENIGKIELEGIEKFEEIRRTEKSEEIGKTEMFEEIGRIEKFEEIERTEKLEEIEAAIKADKNVKKEYIDAILEVHNTDNNTDNHTDNHTNNITDNHTVNSTVNNVDNHTDNSADKNMDNNTDDNTDNNTDINEISMKHIKEEKLEEITEEITETLPSVEISIKIKEEKELETEESRDENIETKKIDIKENINDNKDMKRIGKVEEVFETLPVKMNEKTKGEEDMSKIENNCADEDDDDYLLYLEDILRRIHGEFYADIEKGSGRKPLRDIIPRVRARVLQGIHLTFSGLIPTHQKLHQSRAYKVARAFGAEVTQDLTDKTTHLVAIKPGTAKANAAKKNGNIKIVNPDWLWTCAERWEHVDERLYPLTAKARASRIPPPHCSSPERIEEAERGAGDSFANTINPLMSFTQEEIEIMDKEVDEDMEEQEMEPPIFDAEGECTTTLRRRRKSSESEDSENDEDTYISAKKKKKRSNESSDEDADDDDEDDDDPAVRFRRGEDLPDDLDLGDNSQDSIDDLEPADNEDDREWNAMGAALEREFLSE